MRSQAIISIVLMPVLAFGLSACGSDDLDHIDGPEISLDGDPEEAPIITGGWSDVGLDDPNILAAAQFAASQGAGVELKEIVAAEEQVVAGMNYSMVLELEDGSLWQALVFKTLSDDLELTSFDPA